MTISKALTASPESPATGERKRRRGHYLRAENADFDEKLAGGEESPGGASPDAAALRVREAGDPLEAVKRKVYLGSLAISLPSLPLLWFALGDGDSFIRFVLPPMVLFCLAVAFALWLSPRPIRTIERVTFAAVAAFAFLHLIHGLAVSGDVAELRQAADVTTFPTLIVLYVIAHLIFDTSFALRASLLLYGASFLLVACAVLTSGLDTLQSGDISWIAQTYAFMGAVIVLLYATSFAKAQLSKERAINEIISRLALTDQLTGVSNRRKLYLDLHHEIEALPRREGSLSVILFDLDHFKKINDSHGHDRGDAVLRAVADRISTLLRKSDYFARWGGEEFILLAPETNLAEASNLAERLRRAVAEISPRNEVTASFGISEFAPTDSPESFIKRADEALYFAKTSGRNRVEDFSRA